MLGNTDFLDIGLQRNFTRIPIVSKINFRNIRYVFVLIFFFLLYVTCILTPRAFSLLCGLNIKYVSKS